MDAKDTHKRLMAAYTLLAEETTTHEKFNHLSELLRGVSPQVDRALDQSHYALSTMDKIQEGDVISLSAENLPENTDDEKRRKRMLLLFIKSWKDLKSEVARVQSEMHNPQAESGAGQASMWGRIFHGAKGPLGVITVIAVGVVALQQTSVQVTIQNQGCATMYPGGSIPSIPGFSLPKDPIPSGGTATMTIPPLKLTVDGTHTGTVALTALKYSFSFQLPSNIEDVSLDGQSLLGKTTAVSLSEQDSHVLVLGCR